MSVSPPILDITQRSGVHQQVMVMAISIFICLTMECRHCRFQNISFNFIYDNMHTAYTQMPHGAANWISQYMDMHKFSHTLETLCLCTTPSNQRQGNVNNILIAEKMMTSWSIWTVLIKIEPKRYNNGWMIWIEINCRCKWRVQILLNATEKSQHEFRSETGCVRCVASETRTMANKCIACCYTPCIRESTESISIQPSNIKIQLESKYNLKTPMKKLQFWRKKI